MSSRRSRRNSASSSSRHQSPTISSSHRREHHTSTSSKSRHSRVHSESESKSNHKRRSRSRSHSPWRNAIPLKSTKRFSFGMDRRSIPFQSKPRTTSSNALANSPIRKKPAPVNELDAMSMDIKKDHNSQSGDQRDTKSSSSFRFQQNGGSRGGRMAPGGRFDRPMFGGYALAARQGRDIFRRAPGFVPRRFAGVRDAADGRYTFDRNKRDTMESEELKRTSQTDDPQKPVMNLFDPCKVPTGKSYFTHDDRTNKVMRPRGGMRYSDGGSVRQRRYDDRAPVGWRNTAQVREYGGGDRNYSSATSSSNWRDSSSNKNGQSSSYRGRSESDGVWKHDKFEEEEDGDGNDGQSNGEFDAEQHH
ncbi:unnamed protein product [Anisakis simplex]|uniref:Btz domain-containing protein n=1 Tax=Anisakis simplex TaxID=6269 RepID=A0A0M3K8P7_ANISI|nr:unnamed protein product [Anisakis simplex]